MIERRPWWRNLRPWALLLLLPLVAGAATVGVLASGLYAYRLADVGSERLETEGWATAAATMQDAQPDYERRFAYYEVKSGQDLPEVARYFGVPLAELERDNPGTVVAGSTVKVRPVREPMTPTRPNGRLDEAVVVEDGDLLRVQHEHGLDRPIVTDVPELMRFLADRDAIEEIGRRHYRLLRAVSLEGDIRLDVTAPTVERLELVSTPDVLASLVFDESAALFDGVTVTSVDPTTGKPDTDSPDGRAYLRMKNGRMDVLDSTISYLGNGLKETLSAKAKVSTAQQEGGTYGISWRISDDQLGAQIATGWVEGSTFEHNHFGAYTYGASGILWRDNRFVRNEVYGLDPHDDSNNALVEGNLFAHNGKHGFIVSKRCNYNVIRDNVSIGNELHGFMLHQDSAFNVIEDNVAYDNVDNYVVYASNSNTVRDNLSYLPSSSHVRVNQDSHNTYVTGNRFFGGRRGVYLYAGVSATYVGGNVFDGVEKQLQTAGASSTFYGDNTQGSVTYDVGERDTVVYGRNTIERDVSDIPLPNDVLAGGPGR